MKSGKPDRGGKIGLKNCTSREACSRPRHRLCRENLGQSGDLPGRCKVLYLGRYLHTALLSGIAKRRIRGKKSLL